VASSDFWRLIVNLNDNTAEVVLLHHPLRVILTAAFLRSEGPMLFSPWFCVLISLAASS
jgi:hypothetical protein